MATDPVVSDAAHATAAAGAMGSELLTALVNTAPVGAAVFDTRLRYRWVNQTLCAMNGHDAEELIGRTPSAVLGEIGTQLETLLQQVIHENNPLSNYYFSGQRPGAGRHWMGSYYPLRNRAGELIGVGAIVTDVTEHERSSLRERQFLTGLVQVAQAVASHADAREVLAVVAHEAADMLELDGAVVASFQSDGVALEGRWGNVAAVSAPGTVLPTGTVPATELLLDAGQPQRQVSEAPDAFGFRSRVAAPILVDGALWGAVQAGSPRIVALPEDAEVRLERFADLVGLAVANAAEQRKLIEQASRDALTGLRNRRAFQERIAAEAQRARRHVTGFSLILLDIDEFKAVNDIHGHDVGDEVLVEVARRLCEEVRGEDLLARIGGEEFAWILPDVASGGALLAAERARLLIADTPFPDVGPVTVSAGVANFEEAGEADLLFRQADRALYEAKRRGRNRCVRHGDLDDDGASGHRGDVQSARVAEQAHALPALRALARAIDAKDPATFQHSERVAQLAQQLAQRLGWPRPRAMALRDAALLHDVGKIGIPEQLLLKPGRLTVEEYEQIKDHARLSCQLAREVVTPEQAAWILHQHERWDGGGYPAGLAGDEIPDGAQLLALADAWDAMTIARPYGPPLTQREALRECLVAAGRQFAPAAVDALRALEPRDSVSAGRE